VHLGMWPEVGVPGVPGVLGVLGVPLVVLRLPALVAVGGAASSSLILWDSDASWGEWLVIVRCVYQSHSLGYPAGVGGNQSLPMEDVLLRLDGRLDGGNALKKQGACRHCHVP
jgi:hypothetical protein